MGELRFETLSIPGAEVGPENPLPPLGRQSRQPPDPSRYQGFSDEMLRNMGYGHPANYLPYTLQDRYTRQRTVRDYAVAVLENETLRAEFLLELGGRLRSLVHKPSGRELLECNPVLQPANLAIRNAWFSGGTEWNIGMLGHHPLTCSPLFAARAPAPDGSASCLRMWEWERIRQVPYQIDAWLPDDLGVLLVRIRITNPHDSETPMYWWSNTAVPEAEDVRVIVPADTAYNFGYGGGGPARVEVPEIEGTDVSYVTRIERAADFFFHVPTEDGQRPWVTAVDGDGRGLVQTSTDRLRGRKLFLWGMGAGGRRWQEWLSEPGRRYLEIQAGLAHTQMEHLPMPPKTDWEWLEAYGLMEADAAAVHGDWSDARREVETRLEAMAPRAELERRLREADAVLAKPPQEIVQRGAGWGTLERLRREQAGEPPFSGPALVFDDDSMGAAQSPWRALLLDGQLPAASATAEPTSYMVQPGGRALLEEAVSDSGGHWASWYQLGLMRYAAADYEGARVAWEGSAKLEATPWVSRCLAVLAAEEEDTAVANRHYRDACGLLPDCLPLLIEAGTFLVDHGEAQAWLDIVDQLAVATRAAGRVRLLEARARLASGDFDGTEAILRDETLAINDLREGERSLSHLWFEAHEQRLAQQLGVEADDVLKERVRAEFPLPGHLDFRMS